MNIWTGDGFKDIPADRLGPRMRYKESIDEILSEPYDFNKVKPCIESKVFGIGVESYTVGSAEFALSYAAMNREKCIPLMDNGHYHPTEVVSDKIPALLTFFPEIALHIVIMHCHPANLLAMTYVHTLDEREFTRTLWQMCTECIVVFPDGANVLPWMLCGTNEIGLATAEKMHTARLVVWAQHGIYGAGKDLDETFGLIETAEKAAEIYMKIAHLSWVNTITDVQLKQLAEAFKVTYRREFLK